MFISTTDYIPGYNYQILGLVRGNIVFSKNVGRDLMAGMKSLVGGEIKSYTDMTNESRQEAENRMIAAAAALNADGVIGVRFSSTSVMEGSSEVLCYGTAVKLIQQ